MTLLGAQSINYDLKGNQLNKDGKNYFWDKLNRLTDIKGSGNQLIAAYLYDADNLRVQKQTIFGKEQYYYSSGRVTVDTDDSQNVIREYIHGGQE